MSPARGAEEIFLDALERAESERAAFLDASCAGDAALRAGVLDLLAVHSALGDFLEVPAAQCVGDAPPVERRTLAPGTRVRSYTIVRAIGSGGAGTVYEALQDDPPRAVALKVLDGAPAADSPAEARLLARIEHEDVAVIHEAGVFEADGERLPFLAMELVAGARTLTRFVREQRLGERAVLALFARVCRAVHFGHEQGVVHRDLKPANLLVDSRGRPRVIDFGIAWSAGGGARGPLAGTPEYMSPEQCRGGDAGASGDVYSLGVVLYELLGGRPPHDLDGLGVIEAARRVAEEPPAPLPRGVARELRSIVGRAMAKNPAARYPSAAALAGDVQSFLDHRPVAAAHGGALYRVRKFGRRHRGAVAGTALAAGAVIAGVSLSGESDEERRAADLRVYAANVSAAAAALREHDVVEARRQLDLAPVPLRGWEWRHLHGRLDASRRTIRWTDVALRTGAVSADGRLVAATGMEADKTTFRLRIWDVADGAVLRDATLDRWAWALAFSPDARRLAVGFSGGPPGILDVATGAWVATMTGQAEPVNRIAFDAAGERVFTGSADGTVRTWSAATGECLATLRAHEDRVIGLDVDRSSRLVATGCRDGSIRVFGLADGGDPVTLTGHTGSVEGVALSPDRTRLASCSRDRSVRLWDLAERRLVKSAALHGANVRDVAFSPDGRTFASASFDRTVALWDAASGDLLARLAGHEASVTCVLYSPSGAELISFGEDGAVKFWPAAPADGVRSLRGHRESVTALAFSGDGRWIVSGDDGGAVRVSDLATGGVVLAAQTGGGVRSLAFAGADGRILAVLEDGRAFVVTGDGPPVAPAGASVAGSPCIAAAPALDGWDLYSGAADGTARVSRLGSGDVRAEWKAHGAAILSVAVHAGGELVATGSSDGEIALWRDTGAARVAAARCGGAAVVELRFDPAARFLAVRMQSGESEVRDVPSLRLRSSLAAPGRAVRCLAFSPDGSRLAGGGTDGTVSLWDPASGTAILTLRSGDVVAGAVTFSKDGALLAAGGGVTDHRVTLFDAAPR